MRTGSDILDDAAELDHGERLLIEVLVDIREHLAPRVEFAVGPPVDTEEPDPESDEEEHDDPFTPERALQEIAHYLGIPSTALPIAVFEAVKDRAYELTEELTTTKRELDAARIAHVPGGKA